LSIQKLRQSMRACREAITPYKQDIAAINIAQNIRATAIYQQSRHVAVYCAIGGEINLQPLIEAAWADGKQCYLPVVQGNNMTFARYCEDTEVISNVFGINEPVSARVVITAADLELVLTPLVAFDRKANRLGMGGGYYDRAFSFLVPPSDGVGNGCRKGHWPTLMGVAHACQEVDLLHPELWDVPLDCVVTDQDIHTCV